MAKLSPSAERSEPDLPQSRSNSRRKMPRLFRTVALCLIACTVGLSARASELRLACPNPRENGREASLIQERGAQFVARHAPHELRVNAGRKNLRFIDKAPSDDTGIAYRFCDRGGGFILLRVAEENVFTGLLVDERTGQTLPGGEEVVFSPDGRAYFATEQPSGLDGNHWKIFAANGTLSWSGFSFIPQEGKPDFMQATLSEPTWMPNGELTAVAQCLPNIERKWKVKLIKVSGRWDWRPRKPCA